MSDVKKNWPLIAGLGIPVFMILIIMAIIYLPNLMSPKPRYNFLFAIPGNNIYRYNSPAIGAVAYPDYTYQISNNKVIQTPTTYYYYSGNPTPTKLYLYDVQQNRSREITVAETQNMAIDSSSISPDGYEITYGERGGGGFFPFFFDGGGSDYSKRFLRKGFHNIQLNLPSNSNGDYYYNGNFQLLGWITNK